MKNNNMITTEGDLKLLIKSTNVTWFNFLQYSRITNSLNGGWNFKSYWEDRGIKFINDHDFIRKWTKQSLEESISPKPRNNSFKFERGLSEDRNECMKKEIKTPLSQKSENAINAEIFSKQKNIYPDHGIMGYEIPLAADSDGQLKIDLLSYDKKNNNIGLIELKQADNHNDSPLMGFIELICYGIQIIKCKNNMLKELSEQNNNINDKSFNFIKLILASPDAYYKYWNFNDENKISFGKIISSINEETIKRNTTFGIDCICIDNAFKNK